MHIYQKLSLLINTSSSYIYILPYKFLCCFLSKCNFKNLNMWLLMFSITGMNNFGGKYWISNYTSWKLIDNVNFFHILSIKFTFYIFGESIQYSMSVSLCLIFTFFKKEYLLAQFYYSPLGFHIYYEIFQAYKGIWKIRQRPCVPSSQFKK